MRIRVLLTALAVCNPVSTAAAQGKPDLTGTWTTPPEFVASVPLPAPGVTGTGVKGVAVQRFTQTADTLTLYGNGLVTKFALNGGMTENCARSEGRCIPNQCRARWEGAVLITTCRMILPPSGREAITTQRYSIDGDGSLQVSGIHTTQGVTVMFHSTFVRAVTIVFDEGN
jgi:hypothetical protein